MWLFLNLLLAFEQFKKIGVKFSARLLIELVLSVLFNSTSPYTIHSRDPKENRLLFEKLMYSWVQQFTNVCNIVSLIQ